MHALSLSDKRKHFKTIKNTQVLPAKTDNRKGLGFKVFSSTFGCSISLHKRKARSIFAFQQCMRILCPINAAISKPLKHTLVLYAKAVIGYSLGLEVLGLRFKV